MVGMFIWTWPVRDNKTWGIYLLTRCVLYPLQEAHDVCKAQSASLPSIDSPADLSFLRAWLQMPQSLGGGGFTSRDSIWLDLKVPRCPECYSVSLCSWERKNL